jgi:hypothetical protein
VSPPNVLISFQGEVRLTDFGIAKAALNAMETMAGHIKGRFDYMSSEQAGGARDLDQRSDLFSLGTLLYEMLTGVHPFRADNELGTIERVRTGARRSITEVEPAVPAALAAIVDRGLAVDRNERYPNASAFREALEGFFHDMGFLATVATLAAYVRNLFPEVDPRPTAQRPDDSDILDDADDVDLGPLDSGTGRLDRALASIPSMPTRATPQPAPPGRPVPGQNKPVARAAFEEDVATAVRKVWSAGEQETAIRKIPADLEAGAISLVPGTPEPGPVVRRRPAEARPRTRSERPRTAPPAPPRASIGWLGASLAAAGTVGGLVVGATAVLLLAWAAGLRAAPSLDPPTVRVTAPAGPVGRLAGAVVGTEFDVKPDRAQLVEVRTPGQAPWRRELDLPEGAVVEILVLTTAR